MKTAAITPGDASNSLSCPKRDSRVDRDDHFDSGVGANNIVTAVTVVTEPLKQSRKGAFGSMGQKRFPLGRQTILRKWDV